MINNLHYLIGIYNDNTIDEALISTDEDGGIPADGEYVLESTEDAFTYAYFIDPDVVDFVTIMKQFPSEIDINDLIFGFLKKISDNLAKGQPFDQIILITDNFMDFLNFFGIPVESEDLQDSLISICNGREDIAQAALLEFYSNADGERLASRMRQALDEQSKIPPAQFDPAGYDGEEFYYVTDNQIRDDDYDRPEYQERYPELERGRNFLPMQQTQGPLARPFDDPNVFRFAPQTQEKEKEKTGLPRGLDLPRSMSDTGRKLEFDDEENRNLKNSRSSPRYPESGFQPSFNLFAGGKRTRKYRRKPKKTLKRRKNKKTRKLKRKPRKTLKKRRRH